MNPRNSNLQLNLGNYTGIRAAYMIEYLLSNSSRLERVYDKGIIIPVVDGKEIRDLLKLEDVKKVKKLYQTWWEVRKGGSIRFPDRISAFPDKIVSIPTKSEFSDTSFSTQLKRTGISVEAIQELLGAKKFENYYELFGQL